MKLEFKILWFDDIPSGVVGARDRVVRHLSRQGFKALIKEVIVINDIVSLLPTLEIGGSPDLIMMDWNMGNGTNGCGLDGSDIAKVVRKRFKYQEIVFYSADSARNLRKAIFDKDIDGVFCVNRNNIAAETINVINTMLRKVLDLNQMRGIVMSHVSEFDEKINECLSVLHEKSNGELQNKILSELHKVIKNFHESKLDTLGRDRSENPLEDYKKLSVLDARYGVLKKLLRELTPNGHLDTILDALDKFREDVLTPRNALAHAKEVRVKNKIILKHGDEFYDEKRLSAIRQALLSHEDNFQNIHESIECGHFTPTCTD